MTWIGAGHIPWLLNSIINFLTIYWEHLHSGLSMMRRIIFYMLLLFSIWKKVEDEENEWLIDLSTSLEKDEQHWSETEFNISFQSSCAFMSLQYFIHMTIFISVSSENTFIVYLFFISLFVVILNKFIQYRKK